VAPDPDGTGWYVIPRPLKWIGSCIDLRGAICGPVARFAANGYALDHAIMGGHPPALVRVEPSPTLAGFGRVVGDPHGAG